MRRFWLLVSTLFIYVIPSIAAEPGAWGPTVDGLKMAVAITGNRFRSYGDASLKAWPFPPLCDELSLKPTVFYRWQKEFFENSVAAFGPRRPSGQVSEQHRIAALEQKLQRMNHVLVVMIEEYVALKESAAEVRT